MSDLASLVRVAKGYGSGPARVEVLRGLDLTLRTGEMVAIVGESGVGKSTLLHLLGGLDRPDAGEYRFRGEAVFERPPDALAAFRGRHIGFVFQFHHLLPEFTALENVAMPLLIGRCRAGDAFGRAEALLAELGLGERLAHRPGALSGGEQQRVAVARALASSPRVLLADEPTGNLDFETGARLHDLLRRLNEERRLTVVVVTHNERLASACDRTLRLLGGRLEPLAAAQ